MQMRELLSLLLHSCWLIVCMCFAVLTPDRVTLSPQPEMIGHYLGEFAISYKPVAHGRPGIGATNSSRFIPLK